MKILDAGHRYELECLDTPNDGVVETLTFVKREGDGYPGNKGHYWGTNIQEVLRALIDRVKYLNNQIPDVINQDIIYHLRMALWLLEVRAANRHHRRFSSKDIFESLEGQPVCKKCGHIQCNGECHP
jgi:hypothetical protein